MSIITNAKEIADLVQKLGDVELYRKIVDLEGDIIELTKENRDLKKEVEQLKSQLAFSKKMEYRSPFWFAEGDDVPYCPNCWEGDKKAIHLRNWSGALRCSQCNEVYEVEGKRLPNSVVARKGL